MWEVLYREVGKEEWWHWKQLSQRDFLYLFHPLTPVSGNSDSPVGLQPPSSAGITDDPQVTEIQSVSIEGQTLRYHIPALISPLPKVHSIQALAPNLQEFSNLRVGSPKLHRSYRAWHTAVWHRAPRKMEPWTSSYWLSTLLDTGG